MLKTLLDLSPLFAFFGLYFRFYDLKIATIGMVVASIVHAFLCYFLHYNLTLVQKISLALLIVGGGLTIVTDNMYFIQIKPTIFYWIMAGGFLYTRWQPSAYYSSILSCHLGAPMKIVRQGQTLYACIFLILGTLNLLVAFYFSQTVWVYFKLFFPIVFLMVVTLVYGYYLYRFRIVG